MPTMGLKFVGSGDTAGEIWPDLAPLTDDQVIHTVEPIDVACLPHGMQSGRASVMMRINLPDGRVVLCETSLLIFAGVADAMTTCAAAVAKAESEKN